MPSKRSPLKLQKKFHFYSSFPPIPAKPNFPSQCKYYRVHAEELGLENHCQWKKEPFIFYTESQTLVILEMFHPSPQYVLSSKLFMINTTDSFQIPSSNLPSIAKEWVRKTKAESKLFPAYTINHQQLHIYPTSHGPISARTEKGNAVHIHDGIFGRKKREILPFATTRMDLETVWHMK